MNYDLCLELAINLESAKKHHLKDGAVIKAIADFIYDYDFRDLERLNELIEPLLTANRNTPDRPIRITPQQLLNAEVLEKEISPWIYELREKVFGDKKAPFPSWGEAVKWLKNLRHKGWPKGKRAEAMHIDDYIDKMVKELRGMTVTKDGKPYTGEIKLEWIEGMPFFSDEPPAIVSRETRWIAEAFAINHPSLIMHVLANTKIICGKWELELGKTGSVRLPSGIRIPGANSVTIQFMGNLNLDDMRQIHTTVKHCYGQRKFKRITAKQLELYNLISGRQIPPKRGKVAFWRQVMAEWNREHPEAKYNTWKGVSSAHNRILQNIDRHIIPKPKEASNEGTHNQEG
jgi:hypothetical protein